MLGLHCNYRDLAAKKLDCCTYQYCGNIGGFIFGLIVTCVVIDCKKFECCTYQLLW